MAVTSTTAASGTTSALLIAPTPGQKPFLRGWAAQEDSEAATAKLQILDAQGGNLVVPITLPPNEGIREFVPVETESARVSELPPAGSTYLVCQAHQP